MRTKLSIIKIGGEQIDDSTQLETFLHNFTQLEGFKILVHGGGKLASQLSLKLGIEPQMVDGRRVTSQADLEVITMVYAGLLNKKISAQLQSLGCNALGLSGADANCITSEKRPKSPIDFGSVGDVKVVNTATIHALLQQNLTLVFCALTHDGKGQLLNTNADTIAAELAIGMSALYETQLIYCFNKKGVLADIDDEESVISCIDTDQYAELKSQKAIHEGMLPKMENCFYALNHNVSNVIIGNTDVIKENRELFTELTL